MPNIIETIDSLNDENASEIKEQLKAEADALNKSNKQLYTRAKKAEGFEYDKSKKEWFKKEPEKKEEKKEPEAKEKSNEPDYARLAFLEQRGITNPDDQKMVADEAERLKMPLTDILNFDHIKAKLKDAKDQREAEEGMPKGRGKPGGTTKQDVNYWVDKRDKNGKYATPDDLELANKVIDARIKKQEADNKFSDKLY